MTTFFASDGQAVDNDLIEADADACSHDSWLDVHPAIGEERLWTCPDCGREFTIIATKG